jgi:putative PIN family toxin of toxin-antitoxin system
MKLVLDTNVLIAAFITRGKCSDLLEHCIRNHQLITSDFILDEFHRHLVGKFKYDLSEALTAIELLRLKMDVVIPTDFEMPVCRDADDDMILGTAIAGGAECIVTGDKDLLVIEEFRGVDIMQPAEFEEYEMDKMA